MRLVLLLLGLVGAASAWNYNNALMSLYYSYGAYCPVSQLQSWDCKWCSKNPGFRPSAVITNSTTQAQVYLGYDSSSSLIVVAYRGTSNLENWIQNLKTWKTHTSFPGAPSGVEVHDGFYEVYNSVRPQVVQAFNSLVQAHPGATVLVTGHSLGAALAELTVGEIMADNLPEPRLHTYTKPILIDFGCPRVGNPAWANWFESVYGSGTVRVTNHDDIVPHLPPEAFGFHHTTTEVWENGSNYKVCSSTNGEDPTCADSVAFPTSISDHLHYMQIHESCT